MKVITWNINGIRTVRGSLKTLLDSLEADVICLQETKVTREMLDESIAVVEGYNAYFSYSRKKSGYSGVVTYCKDSVRPVAAEEGISGYWTSLVPASCLDSVGVYGSISDWPLKELQRLDEEGRTVITEHRFRKVDGGEGLVCIINVYCPRADQEREDRKAYKLWFCQMLQVRAEALLAQGRNVIIVGDLNTSHQPIDSCDASDPDYATSPTRHWLNQFLHDFTTEFQVDYRSAEPGHRMVDTFRRCHPEREKAYTCWSTATGARTLNYGCRIDYVLADYHFVKETLQKSEILPEIGGSDHCPVMSEFSVPVMASEKCPSLCAKWMPEFSGKQQKLSSFFQKLSRDELIQKNVEIPNRRPPPAKRLRLSDSVPSSAQKAAVKRKYGTTVPGQKSLLDFFGKESKGKNPVASEILPSPSNFEKNEAALASQIPLKTESSFLIDLVSNSGSFESWDEPEPPDEAISSSQPSSSQAEFLYSRNSEESAAQWRSLLCGPRAAPLCSKHREPCILKTAKKAGPNRNRQFYMCARPEGEKTDVNARCSYFKWIGRK